jgi:hypothetical protein
MKKEKRNFFWLAMLAIIFFNTLPGNITKMQAQETADILEPNPLSQGDIDRADGNSNGASPSPVDFTNDDAGRPIDNNHRPLSNWTIENSSQMSDADIIKIFNTTGVDLNSQSPTVRNNTIQAFRRSLRESQSQYNNTPVSNRFNDIATSTAYNRALTQSIQQFIQSRNQEGSENSTPTTGGQSSGNTNNREYLTINAQGTYSCPEGEGLQGMRFLFFHGPLVPCGVNKQCAGNNEGLSINKPCTLCHFIVLIQNFFNLLLSLLIVVSILMLTIAGVLYIISAGGKMTSMAKEIIQKTLLGFGLFLLSWLIIFTLLSLLSANTSMIGKGDNGIFQFTCDDDSAFYVEPNHQQNPNPPTHQQNPNPPNS